MIKILISGSTGAMGKTLIDIIDTTDDFEFVGGVSNNIIGDENYPIFENFEQIEIDFDVIIDFSHYSVVDDLIAFGVNNKKPLVIATTGLSKDQEKNIENASKKIPIFRAKNFSIGVNLIAQLIKTAQNVLPNFDIEIIEKHHNKKVDSPSGTAYFLADSLNSSEEYIYIHGREGIQTKRQKNEIGIHSIRGGTIVGEHTVIFAGTDEIIEISHSAHSKKVFANGALQAAKLISKNIPALYNMNDLMKGELN